MAPSRPLRRPLAMLAVLTCIALAWSPAPAAAGWARARPTALAPGDADSALPRLPSRPVAATGSRIKWSDVPRRHWARTAIDYVGSLNDWMRDYPQNADRTYPFAPDTLESRGLFARAVVLAFAPDQPVDAGIAFPDLPSTDPLYAYAAVAVQNGWMTADPSGNFLPNDPVTTVVVHRALVLALGLGDLAQGLDAIHRRNGTTFDTPPDFGTLVVGMRIGLRYNHSDESLDVGPNTELSRAEVAWSLYRAATMPSWMPQELARYATITLPNLGPARRRIVQFGIQYVGYPYVYAGEWDAPSPSGYCCGWQPVGGFDCSGITWWVMKAAASGWDNVPPRDYRGWSLPERSSADMAAATTDPVAFEDLKPGDLMFYDGDGNGVVDHVDVYIGDGWAIDSSGSLGGVTILDVASGWYRDHFVFGRRLLGQPPSTARPSLSPPITSPAPAPARRAPRG